MGDWWRDYVQCVLFNELRDCDLLLTNYDSYAGVSWNDRYSVGEGGFSIAKSPSSWDPNGCDNRYLRMSTALHEFGHAIMSKSESFEHSTGDVLNVNEDMSKTAMLYNEHIGSDNQCGNKIEQDDSCHAMYYSECTESHMTRTY